MFCKYFEWFCIHRRRFSQEMLRCGLFLATATKVALLQNNNGHVRENTSTTKKNEHVMNTDTLDTKLLALVLELLHAANRCGVTRQDIKWLSMKQNFDKVLPTIRAGRFVDLSAVPFAIEGFGIVRHVIGVSNFEWDKDPVSMYVHPKQRSADGMSGHDLAEQMQGKNVFNTCLMKYLLENQHLIPSELRDKRQYFWGTIYSDREGNSCVCYLRYRGDEWVCDFTRLSDIWYHDCVALYQGE